MNKNQKMKEKSKHVVRAVAKEKGRKRDDGERKSSGGLSSRQSGAVNAGNAMSAGIHQMGTGPKKIPLTGRERMGSITSTSTGFHIVHNEAINPGLPTFLPFGSLTGRNYEEYCVESLRFVFETAVPTTTPGQVAISFDADSTDANATTFTVFVDGGKCALGQAWQPKIVLALSKQDCMQGRDKLFVRLGGLAYSDYLNYDSGRIRVALNGVPVGYVGDIWCEYNLALRMPNADLLPGVVTVAKPRMTTCMSLIANSPFQVEGATYVIPGTGFLAVEDPIGVTTSAAGILLPKGAYRISVSAVIVYAFPSADPVHCAFLTVTTNNATYALRTFGFNASGVAVGAVCTGWTGAEGVICCDGVNPIVITFVNAPGTASGSTLYGDSRLNQATGTQLYITGC